MMGHRYYSPELCRFIQPADVSSLDPQTTNGLNLFIFKWNNPLQIFKKIELENNYFALDVIRKNNTMYKINNEIINYFSIVILLK